MQTNSKPIITLKRLEGLSKSKLTHLVRDMETYLCHMAKSNDEMSWRGIPEVQQLHFTRAASFSEAATHIQLLAANADL